MKIKKSGILLSALLLAAMVLVPYASAYQASSYGPLYSNLDTASVAQNATTELSSMGYTSTSYTGSTLSATDARTRMANDNVFFFDGHGAPGIIQFPVSGITARNSGAFSSYLESSNNQLRDIVLAVYMACNTGVLSDNYGNLLTQSYSEGIDMSVGWITEINSAQSSYWSDRFWYWLDEGCSVKIASQRATSDTRDAYQGILGGMNNQTCRGDNYCSMTIDPARAGYY